MSTDSVGEGSARRPPLSVCLLLDTNVSLVLWTILKRLEGHVDWVGSLNNVYVFGKPIVKTIYTQVEERFSSF